MGIVGQHVINFNTENKMEGYFVRQATENDMGYMFAWTRNQREPDGIGFLNNWRRTEYKYLMERGIYSCVDMATGMAVGYIHNDFYILSVKESERMKGVGRLLVEYAKELYVAQDIGSAEIEIECQPETSIPFWKSMGFEVYPHHIGYRARFDPYLKYFDEEGNKLKDVDDLELWRKNEKKEEQYYIGLQDRHKN